MPRVVRRNRHSRDDKHASHISGQGRNLRNFKIPKTVDTADSSIQ